MRMYDIIQKKRQGSELTDREICFFIDGYTAGDIPDYQASALCMAICFQGMTDREIATLTAAMAHSGDTLDLSAFGELSADKHSTGGVGDKTTLIVAPIVASLGGKMAKMSGRGLGHTGGTVDKLESIPGYRTTLPPEEFSKQVADVGLAVIGQSRNLAPADKALYALRDVTATVDSIPLITSSIMSKKLAAGSRTIVLDVKVGSGAFMKTPKQAEELAQKMVTIGKLCGRRMAALITDMNAPLGREIGNAREVREAIEVLQGTVRGDLREVCVALAENIVSLVFDLSANEAAARVADALDSGAAFLKMREWIAAQGGDVRYIENADLFPAAVHKATVTAPCDGYVAAMDAEKIGSVGVLLGAGRACKNDEIDHSAGLTLLKKPGDLVQAGDALCILHTNRAEVIKTATENYLAAVTFSDTPPVLPPLIHKVIR